MIAVDLKNSLDKVVSARPSRWMVKALRDQANEAWLDRSAEVALLILSTLHAKNLSQKELAAMIGVSPQQVSKIVKGNVNLTLETISKLEAALDIRLLEVPGDQVERRVPQFKSKTGVSYNTRVSAGKRGSMVQDVSGSSGKV